MTVEDAIAACWEKWARAEKGILMDSFRLSVMSWSDNIFTFARSAVDAAEMMGDLEEQLGKLHGLQIKGDSREIIKAACVSYSSYTFRDGGGKLWCVKPVCRVLGSLVSCTGSPTEDIERTISTIYKAYFKNPVCSPTKKLTWGAVQCS